MFDTAHQIIPLTTGEATPAKVEAWSQAVFDSLDLTEATRADYKYRIGEFLQFISNTPFDRDTLIRFKRFLAERNDISVSTKNKYFATAKIFLKELNRRGLLPADITQNVKAFSQNKKHKRDGLNTAEITKVADALKELPTTPANTRLRAILSLLTFQGLRQIEIVRLDVCDIDFVGKRAFIRGKGRDDKEPVDLHPATVVALKDYLKENKVADGALFISSSNNSRKRRLTTRGLRLIVTGFLEGLDIEKSTHGFRHYFTTTLVRQFQGNLLEVSGYTRHRSLEMLQVYYDRVRREADLPKYYEAFKGVHF